MLTVLIKNQLYKNRELILREGHFLGDFMHLLMRHVNTGEKWSKDEIALLKKDLRHLSCYVPVLVVFLLPFGSLLLPLLAEVLDRREKRRQHDIEAKSEISQNKEG